MKNEIWLFHESINGHKKWVKVEIIKFIERIQVYDSGHAEAEILVRNISTGTEFICLFSELKKIN